jgi:hypothetical protein
MLDMYPPGPVEDAYLADGAVPTVVASHYDTSGYSLTADLRGWHLRGGPRYRLFGQQLQLMKYPLVFWGRFSGLSHSNHTPTPFWRNLDPIYGVLLHFKFLADFRTRFAEAVQNAQHRNAARAYAGILTRVKEMKHLEMTSAGLSKRYLGESDLVGRGFMAELPA